MPENSARGHRDLTFLIGHPAMVQLMTDDAKRALIHIKLAPMDGAQQVEVTAKIREIVDRFTPTDGTMRVASTSIPAVAEIRDRETAERITRLTGIPIDVAALRSGKQKPPKALVAKVIELRDGLDHFEDGIFAVEIPELESLEVEQLLVLRGDELESYMRKTLTTAVAEDPEGIAPAAKRLGAWIDEEKGKYKLDAWCATLDLEARCDELGPALAEFEDEQWRIPATLELPADATAVVIDTDIRLTGQPVIGQAFAESVTRSLLFSTGVSIIALGLVLLVTRSLFALVPALWTLAFSAGIIAVMGHPIGVGTSMITCIALGAGVDFAIHLGFRARSYQVAGRWRTGGQGARRCGRDQRGPARPGVLGPAVVGDASAATVWDWARHRVGRCSARGSLVHPHADS